MSITASKVTVTDILEAFPKLVELRSGQTGALIAGPCPQTNPSPNGIAFVSEAEFLEILAKSALAVIVVNKKIAHLVGEAKPTVLVSSNPYLAMALVNQRFFPVPHQKKRISEAHIHPTAVIHPSAQISASASIGPNTVIYDGVQVGENTFIGANCVIESNVTIGENCFIHHLVYVGHSTQIGNTVEIKPNSTVGSDGFGYAHDEKGNHYRLPHYGPLIIEDDVHIGANVNIDRGTFEAARVGMGTKIDNHCHFGHNAVIGKNNLMTAGFISAGSAKIGDNCVFAGRASVNGHIEICAGVTIGPLSGVTNNVTQPGAYMGFPPIAYKDALRSMTTWSSLPRMRKNLSQVMKQLGLTEE